MDVDDLESFISFGETLEYKGTSGSAGLIKGAGEAILVFSPLPYPFPSLFSLSFPSPQFPFLPSFLSFPSPQFPTIILHALIAYRLSRVQKISRDP